MKKGSKGGFFDPTVNLSQGKIRGTLHINNAKRTNVYDNDRQVSSATSMTVPTVDRSRLVIVGATGMVGGYALRYALDNSDVGSVTAVGRKTLGIAHPKLKEVLHQGFADCSPLAEILSGQSAAVYCLGAYTGSVSDAELHRITVDYTIEFARVLPVTSPLAAFSFLSGSGADPTGRSRMAFARYKGEAEKALLAAEFARLCIFRPAYIFPVQPPEGTQSQLPPNARDLSGVPCAVAEPSNSRRRFGAGHGGRRRSESSGAPNPAFREP